jgi:hypothetical protein
MVVNYGRAEPHVNLSMIGAEVVPAEVEKKADARQVLWDLLDEADISYKKNMSKVKLQELLE